MPFFNTLSTFLPFSVSQSIIQPIITSASYGPVTASSIQIVNIRGKFTKLRVDRYDLTNNVVTTTIVSPFKLGMTYLDTGVTTNISYSYVLYPIVGGNVGTIPYTIPGTINALVDNTSIIDNTGMYAYYTFENPMITDRPPKTLSVQVLNYNNIVDPSGCIMYYPADYYY